MPRPTNAQVAYGSLTVVLSTLVLLLLTDARSGAGVTAVAAGGLVLGLLVAAGVAARSSKTAAQAAMARTSAVRTSAALNSMAVAPRARLRVRGGAAEQRMGEHSLRR
jgi:hypothetical protein